MEKTLREPDGWLTLVGLHWLSQGDNPIGSAPDLPVPLPVGTAPDIVGTLHLDGDQITFTPHPGVTATIQGQPITQATLLESDVNRSPTIVQVGEVTFHILLRGDYYAVRVKQPTSPTRLNFAGRRWWPADANCRVQAHITRYDLPKAGEIPDMLGNTNPETMDCQLSFEIDGTPCTLDGSFIPTGQVYLIFHDLSCGQGSYPAGHFLLTEIPSSDERVVIDFNKAYNPPCAFTDFATCPLPPQQNHLAVHIHAGEKYTSHHHGN